MLQYPPQNFSLQIHISRTSIKCYYVTIQWWMLKLSCHNIELYYNINIREHKRSDLQETTVTCQQCKKRVTAETSRSILWRRGEVVWGESKQTSLYAAINTLIIQTFWIFPHRLMNMLLQKYQDCQDPSHILNITHTHIGFFMPRTKSRGNLKIWIECWT